MENSCSSYQWRYLEYEISTDRELLGIKMEKQIEKFPTNLQVFVPSSMLRFRAEGFHVTWTAYYLLSFTSTAHKLPAEHGSIGVFVCLPVCVDMCLLP